MEEQIWFKTLLCESYATIGTSPGDIKELCSQVMTHESITALCYPLVDPQVPRFHKVHQAFLLHRTFLLDWAYFNLLYVGLLFQMDLYRSSTDNFYFWIPKIALARNATETWTKGLYKWFALHYITLPSLPSLTTLLCISSLLSLLHYSLLILCTVCWGTRMSGTLRGKGEVEWERGLLDQPPKLNERQPKNINKLVCCHNGSSICPSERPNVYQHSHNIPSH